MPGGIKTHDELEIWRCPSLGGPVPFRHCRKTNNGSPCQSVAACWGGRIDLAAFLKKNYTAEDIEKVFGTPKKSRLETIFETLDKKRDA